MPTCENCGLDYEVDPDIHAEFCSVDDEWGDADDDDETDD